MTTELLKRLRFLFRGQVQGVGFRPLVYRIALQLNLTGWVQNTAVGVVVEVQGKNVSGFLEKLLASLPALIQLDNIHSLDLPTEANEKHFYIKESLTGPVSTRIPPDLGVCSKCLYDLLDEKSHYYHYPLLNCTQCGPRFTIIHDIPYDRERTSMDKFPMCRQCREDYHDPLNRRYHAEATACRQCGPQLSVSIDEVARSIQGGGIVALKGLGGYQFIGDATNQATVKKLREQKNREAKPLALMLLNITSVASIVDIDDVAMMLLQSPERPIVLLPRKDTPLPEIADGLSHFGVMLPSMPLHFLLFHALANQPKGHQWLSAFHPSILVVTSANLQDEPLVMDDSDAEKRLGPMVDYLVSYPRKIIARVDDSVLCVVRDKPLFIRRARGYVPVPIRLPYAIPSTLALGGYLKNTFCITRDDEAFVSQHIGGMNNKATIDFFHESIAHLLQRLQIEPQCIAHDLHPDFYTSQIMVNQPLPTYAVQHHHAHLAAVVAEYGIQQPVLGLALDGYGYGTGGEAWGGELMLLEGTAFTRLGSLLPIPQPGGDLASKDPWRMAAGLLFLLGRGEDIKKRFSLMPQASSLLQLLEKGIQIPMTSSCGRLFDAVSALLGVQTINQYESQAAMMLESLVTEPQVLKAGWRIEQSHFNLLPTIDHLLSVTDRIHGANLFHGTLIAGLSQWLLSHCRDMHIDMVVLSGGCFLNKVLSSGLIKQLTLMGIKPLLPRLLPPNDGGISLGQAWVAGRMNHVFSDACRSDRTVTGSSCAG